ncbi:DUF4041 domain-containing protein [Loktanella sp. M215]|uniref:DUF4041 domain-containing protein n=1 Tax=Loktanella sp. M215 TaxID=2675431 RepID=UPI001F30A4E4|nr:DUF4041 domain-containing protein [Loktanella sp. M215]MCF7701590.1 DUF4041 domain-containing protein [Loktanella sp. M215]
MTPMIAVVLGCIVASPILLILLLLSYRKFRKFQAEATRATELQNLKFQMEEANSVALREKYSSIISHEDEVARLKSQANDLLTQITIAQKSYAEKRGHLDRLEAQVAVYDERLAFAELGVYEPHFDFGDSEEFKKQIKVVRDEQKAMITAKRATHCPTEWTVEGSKSKGQTMINRQSRLTMRAFNNECEAAIANIRWNNAVAMEKRIQAAAGAINKENASMQITLSEAYVMLRIKELRLNHEYREQIKVEKDERAESARAEREEKKLLAQAEAAERDEQKYQDLLDKARKEAGIDGGTDAMQERIAELEASLAAAHTESERARAMAEMTKSGYVYIISNVGSFGEDVVKIGLTRRLDPDDRVRELGDASVPFSFDTHAMIYSDEAPALEFALHREFAERRINMSNMRKEFFRVGLEEVEDAVARLAPDANFFKDREAQEWLETLARRNNALADLQAGVASDLPATI